MLNLIFQAKLCGLIRPHHIGINAMTNSLIIRACHYMLVTKANHLLDDDPFIILCYFVIA